jgi:hypothetical protein
VSCGAVRATKPDVNNTTQFTGRPFQDEVELVGVETNRRFSLLSDDEGDNALDDDDDEVVAGDRSLSER